jgi:hypothetical protein
VVDATAGVDIVFEAYEVVGTVQNFLFDFHLYKNDDLLSFGSICIPFGNEADGICFLPPDYTDEEDYEDIESFSPSKRGLLETRKEPKPRQYLLYCDKTPPTTPITVEPYPSPTVLALATPTVPIIKPGIAACEKSNCPVGNWSITRGVPSDVTNPNFWRWACKQNPSFYLHPTK